MGSERRGRSEASGRRGRAGPARQFDSMRETTLGRPSSRASGIGSKPSEGEGRKGVRRRIQKLRPRSASEIRSSHCSLP